MSPVFFQPKFKCLCRPMCKWWTSALINWAFQSIHNYLGMAACSVKHGGTLGTLSRESAQLSPLHCYFPIHCLIHAITGIHRVEHPFYLLNCARRKHVSGCTKTTYACTAGLLSAIVSDSVCRSVSFCAAPRKFIG